MTPSPLTSTRRIADSVISLAKPLTHTSLRERLNAAYCYIRHTFHDPWSVSDPITCPNPGPKCGLLLHTPHVPWSVVG